MTPINDQDFELLSAYLDDELGASQRSALETRLTTDPALAAALEELQQTVRILHATPRLAVPRNFTLDPARYARPAPWWMRYGVMQLVGAVGAAASVMIIAAGVYLSGMSFAELAEPSSGANAVAQSGAASNISNAGVPVEATQTQIAAGRNAFSPTETALSTMLPTQTVLMKSSTEAQPPNPMAAVAESAAEEPSVTATPTMTATGTMEFYSTQSKDAETAMQPAVPGGDLDIPSGGVGMTDAAGSAGEQDGMGGGFAGDPNAAPPSQGSPADNAPVLVATVEETPTVLPTTFAPATALAYDATRDDAFAEKTVPVEGTTVANFNDENAPADKVDGQLGQDTANDILNRQNTADTPVSQFILIAGIALLVFSVMLFLLGWLRTRQRL